MKVRAQKEAS